ncbi:L,D-transpeptidase [Streptomyces sp. PTM05]|uniref:L,D-transpeptidase n=1 Tax=Streptantibioticus parmotrematis TaxID=2873249 RepID=A0ABS7QZA4_9ACTN|nr:L,D-transpeptidase [Streptantibioticus parmotrematis]MBY8887102.1 L,D-transpeptidase [Streptantibioticus parmotrematis]
MSKGIGVAALVGAMALGMSGCGGNSSDSKSGAAGASTTAKASGSASPSSTPQRPQMLLNTIEPQNGTTVGVAMPISVTFSKPVAASARADIEKHLKLTTSTPVTGAWHWFDSTRVDFRPKAYWPAGTKVTLNAQLTGVGDGNGRYGVHSYVHSFTIGKDDEVHVYADQHLMKVSENGTVVKTFPIDAGSPQYPSWNGTMAVIGKAREVLMDSCSVHIACSKSDPNYYHGDYPFAVQLTTSGTYVHYSDGDPEPGHGTGSHGCVHLSKPNAEWFFDFANEGDPVTISGSTSSAAKPNNGYADYDVTNWSDWIAPSSSGTGQFTTTAS